MDSGLLTVLGLSLLPAAGNFVGGLLSELMRPSARFLNWALHGAAGIILAVIAVEVMPEALQAASVWVLAPAFLAGGGLYMLIQAGIERGQGAGNTGTWLVYVAVAADLLGDGLLIGSGSAVSASMGLVLALGQVMADIPEGFAVSANFRDKGVGRLKRLLLSASFLIPVVGGALLSYFLLRSQSEPVKMAALVFVAGLYTLAAVEDMLNEAHDTREDSRWSALSMLMGFALFLVVSGGFSQ